MYDVKQQFAARLREAMESAGYAARPSVLEREFNQRYWGKPITLHGVRRWLLGETMPSQEKLQVLAKWLGISAAELLTLEPPRRVEDKARRWEYAGGFEDRRIFEAFLRLPVPQRRIVREVIVAFDKAYGDGDDGRRGDNN